MTANLKPWSTQVDELPAKMRDAVVKKTQGETVVAAMKMPQTAYQEPMKMVGDASDTAFAGLRESAEGGARARPGHAQPQALPMLDEAIKPY